MGLVLDTSAYSAGERNDPAVRQLISVADQLILPIIVIGELLFGFRNGNRLAENERLLKRFITNPRVDVVLIDKSIAEQYAQVKYNQQISGYNVADNDLWIAAVCLSLQQPLLTLDTDFEHIAGLDLLAL